MLTAKSTINFLVLIIFLPLQAMAQFDQLQFYQENDLWGLKTLNGDILISPKYENDYTPYFDVYSSSFATIKYKNKYGLLNREAKEIVEPVFDEIYHQEIGNYLLVKKNNQWQVFDLQQLQINSSYVFDHIEIIKGYRKSEIEEIEMIDFNESFEEEIRTYRTYKTAPLLLVNNGGTSESYQIKGGKFGLFIWQDGLNSLNEYLPTEYDELKTYDFFVLAKKDNRWYGYDYEGKEMFLNQRAFTFIEYDINKDVFLVNNEGGDLVMNSFWFDDRHYAGGKFGYFNSEGKVIVPLEYDYVRPKLRLSEMNDSLYLVKVGKNGKFGIINLQGKIVLPVVYDEIDDHIFSYNDFMDTEPYFDSNGLFKVRKGSKWGMVDLQNNPIIPIIYDHILQSEIYYQVQSNGKYFYFNSAGKSIKKPNNVFFIDKKNNEMDNAEEK